MVQATLGVQILFLQPLLRVEIPQCNCLGLETRAAFPKLLNCVSTPFPRAPACRHAGKHFTASGTRAGEAHNTLALQKGFLNQLASRGETQTQAKYKAPARKALPQFPHHARILWPLASRSPPLGHTSPAHGFSSKPWPLSLTASFSLGWSHTQMSPLPPKA